MRYTETQDITNIIEKAMEEPWSKQDALSFLEDLQKCITEETFREWEEPGFGSLFLLSSDELLAFVSKTYPLVVLVNGYFNCLNYLRGTGVEFILVPDMDEEFLATNLDVLKKLIVGFSWHQDNVDCEAFCGRDLWWAAYHS